jgi:TetR/AcrR family transcriptional regulator
MRKCRDLNRTRRRIMAAALAEFSAKGLAGARTDVIARRAGVHEGMIFYCFKTNKTLYREVLRRRLAESQITIEAKADDSFASRLADGYESVCGDADYVRMTQ